MSYYQAGFEVREVLRRAFLTCLGKSNLDPNKDLCSDWIEWKKTRGHWGRYRTVWAEINVRTKTMKIFKSNVDRSKPEKELLLENAYIKPQTDSKVKIELFLASGKSEKFRCERNADLQAWTAVINRAVKGPEENEAK